MTCKCPNCGCEFAQEKPFVPWEKKNHATITALPAGADSLQDVDGPRWRDLANKLGAALEHQWKAWGLYGDESKAALREWQETRTRPIDQALPLRTAQRNSQPEPKEQT